MLRPKLNRIWASANAVTRRDPGDTKYITGWISEIPTYQVLNYLQYKTDLTLLALAERGVFEWGSDVQYGLNSLAWDETNKVIYVSTVGSPDKTKAPSTNPTQWVASSIQVTRASYDAVVAAINAHIADVTGNPHRLTAGRLNAYNKTEIDNIVAQYRALVKAHVDDKNNPHGVTATQIGAVPVTGGTYTGDVIFNAGVWFDANKVNGIVKDQGLWMSNGAGRIGINASGVGYVGVAGLMSPIVTEAAYPNLKAAQEPSYAVPMPDLQMNLIGEININSGVGYVDDPSPGYNPSAGNCYQYDPTNGAKSISGSESIFASGSNFTIAVDLMSPDGRTAGSGQYAVTAGTFGFSIVGQDDGTYAVKLTSASGSTLVAKYLLTGPTGQWYRFAATFDGTNYILYVNGVEVAREAGTPDTTKQTTINVGFYGKTAATKRVWNVRNFRIWAQALTAKQVSNL